MANRLLTLIALILGVFTSGNLAQQSQNQDCRGQKADIIFLLDSSTSEGPSNFQIQLDFVKNLTQIYDIGRDHVQVGLVTFSTNIHEQFWLNTYHDKTALIQAIDRVPFTSGNTNTGGGLHYVSTQGFTSAHGMRTGVPHIIVVMTDGQSQDSQGTASAAAQAHQTGIEVMAIGIGSGVHTSELQAIASDPKHVLTVSNFLALASIQHNVASATCSISVPATTAIPAPAVVDCHGQKADIIFLLDSSSSEGSRNFQHQLDFVKNLTAIYDIGPNYIQLGLTTFSTNIYEQFWLNTHHTAADISRAIDRVHYTSGNTNTGGGLHYVTTQGFTAAHGMRTGVPHIIVVMTDGQSQNAQGTASAAAQAHQAGIEVMAIGIGSGVRTSELQAIASDPKHVLTVANFLALASIQHNVAAATCNTNTGTPSHTGSGTSACGPSGMADIVFALDASGTEGASNFQKSLSFMSQFVNDFTVSPNHVQFSLVTYGAHTSAEFTLNQHHSKSSVIHAIQHASYIGGAEEVYVALHMLMNYSFKPTAGARPNTKRYIIFVMNGAAAHHSLALSQAAKLHQLYSDVTVITIGVGSAVNSAEANAIASDNHNVFRANNFDGLRGIKDAVRNAICGGTSPTSGMQTTTPGDSFEVLPDHN